MSAKQMTPVWLILRVLTGSESMPSRGRQAASLPGEDALVENPAEFIFPCFSFTKNAISAENGKLFSFSGVYWLVPHNLVCISIQKLASGQPSPPVIVSVPLMS